MRLEARHIGISYEGKPVLSDVTITVESGHTIALIGPSGIGKTTLFDIISGAIAPDEGEVLLDGRDVTGLPGHVGYMLQKDLLLPYRTVLDNVALPLILRGVRKDEARRRAAEHFERFGLAGTEERYPDSLSGGMRQRAAFLRTYLFGATIVLLDEPFGALDALTRRSMREWYAQVSSELGLGTLLITHDVDEAVMMADRVYVLNGSPAHIVGIVESDAEDAVESIMDLLEGEAAHGE